MAAPILVPRLANAAIKVTRAALRALAISKTSCCLRKSARHLDHLQQERISVILRHSRADSGQRQITSNCSACKRHRYDCRWLGDRQDGRGCSPSSCRPRAAAAGRDTAGRRLAAAAQHGVDRWQPSATPAVPLFPHARCGLQQAPAGLGLRRHQWDQAKPYRPRHQRQLCRDSPARLFALEPLSQGTWRLNSCLIDGRRDWIDYLPILHSNGYRVLAP